MDFRGQLFSPSERKTLAIISTDGKWDRAKSGGSGGGGLEAVPSMEVFCREFRT